MTPLVTWATAYILGPFGLGDQIPATEKDVSLRPPSF